MVVIFVAAILRLVQLDELPPGLHHDEAYNGLDALALTNRLTFPIFHEGWELYAQDAHEGRPIYETDTPVFFEGNYGREPLFVYLVAASISFLGPTLTSIRIVSALVGLIAVGATFLAARALLWPGDNGSEESGFLDDWPVLMGPLLAAFFMAILFPMVQYSRIGVRAISFVPLEAMVVYFLWKGIRRVENTVGIELTIQGEDVTPMLFRSVKIGWFAAAGVFLGLGLYTYAAARFMPLLIIAFFFIWWLQERRVFNRYFVNIFILAAASIITAGPLILFFLRQPYYLVYRSRFIANRGTGTYPGRPWITWVLNIGRVVRGLFWQGDQNIVNNLPGRPFLDPIQSFLVFLGAISMVRRRPRIRDQFLVIWLLVMLLPGILTGDAPHFGRLLGAAAPLALIISLGCIWLVKTIRNINISWGPALRKVAIFVLITLLLLSLGLTVFDYFSRYQGDSELRAGFDNDDWQLGLVAAALPEQATVYLSPTQEKMATILYAFGGQEERLRSFFSPLKSLLPAGVPGKAAYYLLRSQAGFVNDQINTYFPKSYTDSRHSDYDVLVIPADSVRGENSIADDISWGGAISLENWQADQGSGFLDVTLTWQAQVPMDRSYTIFVHLLNENGELVAQLDRPPDGYLTSDWQEGEIVIDSLRLELPADMQPGAYFIQSGFYYLPTQERLGEPQLLREIDIK
ncbi:MAG: hypothetical protein BMS9Abin02_0863 [Anaerolineae bacterium]|nr:MAG: hypothetical protein BMS9Abin02_0863 [Anaerolineae bacterium]